MRSAVKETTDPMSYSFTFFPELNLVYKRVWGSYQDVDSKSAHTYWDTVNQGEVGGYNELQDLREVNDYGISLTQIRSLANHYESGWQQEGSDKAKKMAYVAPSPIVFGTGRVYSTLISTTGINFKVFESIDDAAIWLGLSKSDLSLVLSRSLPGDTPPNHTGN